MSDLSLGLQLHLLGALQTLPIQCRSENETFRMILLSCLFCFHPITKSGTECRSEQPRISLHLLPPPSTLADKFSTESLHELAVPVL